ncbi:MAG: ATP-binding protein [Roseiflexaceae bacterium]
MSVQPSEVIRLDLPATHKYLNILGACISELLARVENVIEREAISYNLQLAAHEACANIIDHAYAGDLGRRILVIITLTECPRQLIIELQDTGYSFDPATVPQPNLNEAHDHGYGLFLMHSLMDEVTYTSRPEGNHWTLVKHL